MRSQHWRGKAFLAAASCNGLSKPPLAGGQSTRGTSVEVDLGTAEGVPPDISSLDEALKSYSVFIVKPISKESVIENGRDILTWFKVQVTAKLSIAPASSLAPSLSSLPFDIMPKALPENSTELLILHNGGFIEVDGVSFSKAVKDFPQLQLSKSYLCVLSLSEDGKVGIVPLGGFGIFEILEGQMLKPLAAGQHPFTDDLKGSYAASLSQLSNHIRTRAGLPKE